MFHKLLLGIIAIALFFPIVLPVYAIEGDQSLKIECGKGYDGSGILLPGCKEDGKDKYSKTGALETLRTTVLPRATSWFVGAIGAISIIIIMIGGVQILLALGDEGKVKAAGKTIAYAVIGLVIAMLSYAIISIINNIPLGFD